MEQGLILIWLYSPGHMTKMANIHSLGENFSIFKIGPLAFFVKVANVIFLVYALLMVHANKVAASIKLCFIVIATNCIYFLLPKCKSRYTWMHRNR